MPPSIVIPVSAGRARPAGRLRRVGRYLEAAHGPRTAFVRSLCLLLLSVAQLDPYYAAFSLFDRTADRLRIKVDSDRSKTIRLPAWSS